MDFELLRILNYWSLNYRGSTVVTVYMYLYMHCGYREDHK